MITRRGEQRNPSASAACVLADTALFFSPPSLWRCWSCSCIPSAHTLSLSPRNSACPNLIDHRWVDTQVTNIDGIGPSGHWGVCAILRDRAADPRAAFGSTSQRPAWIAWMGRATRVDLVRAWAWLQAPIFIIIVPTSLSSVGLRARTHPRVGRNLEL